MLATLKILKSLSRVNKQLDCLNQTVKQLITRLKSVWVYPEGTIS